MVEQPRQRNVGALPLEEALRERRPRHERQPGALALLQHGLVRAVGEVVAVLDGDDRRDGARTLELRAVDVADPDVADVPSACSSTSAPSDSSSGTSGSTTWSW